MSIYIRIGKKNEKKKKKIERPKYFLSSYKDFLQELNLENNDESKKFRLYLKHQEIEDIIIDNKKVWNFLYNFSIIQECIKLNKNNHEMLDIEYEVIEDNQDKSNPNLSNVINYIIKKDYISQNFYLDVLYKFIEKYKGEFKNFFISELIFYKTKNKEEENNNISEIVETEKFLKSFKEKIKNINQTLSNFNKISKIIEDEKSQEIFEKSETNEAFFTDLKSKEIKNNPLNDSINENLIKYSNSEKKLHFDINKMIDKGMFKILSKEKYNEGFEDYKEKLNKNILEDYNLL